MAEFLRLVKISSDLTLEVFGDNMGVGEKFVVFWLRLGFYILVYIVVDLVSLSIVLGLYWLISIDSIVFLLESYTVHIYC